MTKKAMDLVVRRMIEIVLPATLLLLLMMMMFVGQGCDSGTSSNSAATVTSCSDVTGVSIPEANEIIAAAESESVPVEDSLTPDSNSDSTITGFEGDTSNGQIQPFRGEGITVVQCGGTLIDNDSQTTTNTQTDLNLSGDTTTEKVARLVRAISEGKVASIELR